MLRFLIPLLISLLLCLAPAVRALDNGVATLPSASTWQSHVLQLGRYWLQGDGWGSPAGNFPTWRCNDGGLYQGEPCPGLMQIPEWMAPALGRDYVRMQSRQTFAYGVLFQLSGDRRALALHEAGVAHLKRVARDPAGGFYSWFEQGKGMPARRGRTTQDLAYALLGIAFHAYLTHDPDSLQLVAEGQRYIYDHYWDHQRGELRWVLDGSAGENPAARELVAQLDQLNAYLLLSWRLWPDEVGRERWASVIRQTSSSLMVNYHDRGGQRLWGTLGQADSQDEFGRHNDFGHTAKGYWMLWLAARGLGDEALAAEARQALATTLDRAWQPIAVSELPQPLRPQGAALDLKVGNWAADGHTPVASWWQWAELDQAALTLAVDGDSQQLPRLGASLQQWLGPMTDSDWGELKATTKQHFWRNGYHSTEHALIGTLLTNSLRGEPTTLWFAPVAKPLGVPFTPYFYSATETTRELVVRHDGPPLVAVSFAPVQLPSRISQGTR